MRIDVVTLGASKLDEDSGALLVQAAQPVGDSTEDVESFGEVAFMCCPGIVCAPWPADENGYCEAVVLGGIGGADAVVVGGRDTRFASIAGNVQPGDMVVHSLGPNQAAQLQLKETKKQALLVTVTEDGKTATMGLDGLNGKAVIALLGYMVEVSGANGITLTDKTGSCGIQIKDGQGSLFGSWTFGGRVPVGTLLYSVGGAPVVGTSGTALPLPGAFAGV